MGIVAVVAEGRWRLWGSWLNRGGVGGAHVWQLEGRARARTRASEQNASCVVRSRILVLA